MDGTAGNRRKARGASTGGGGPRPSLATVLESQRAFVSLCATILSDIWKWEEPTHTHKLLQNILGTLFFKAERHVSDSQLFRAYWVLGNVLHLMYMNFSEPPYKICIIVFRVSQAA